MDKCTNFAVYGLGTILRDNSNKRDILKKIGFKSIVNSLSYILSISHRRPNPLCSVRLAEIVEVFAETDNFAMCFKQIRGKFEEIFTQCYRDYVEVKVKGSGESQSKPFELGGHWFYLSFINDHIWINYFKPLSIDAFSLDKLKSLYNLDTNLLRGEEWEIGLDESEFSSINDKLELYHNVKEKQKVSLNFFDDTLKLLKNVNLPSILVFRSIIQDGADQTLSVRSQKPPSTMSYLLCIDGESACLGKIPQLMGKNSSKIEVQIESNQFVAQTYTQYIYEIVERILQRKPMEGADFSWLPINEVCILLKMIRFLRNGGDQESAVALTEWSRHDLTQ